MGEAENDHILRERCGNGSGAALEGFTCSSGKERSLCKGMHLSESNRQGHLSSDRGRLEAGDFGDMK